MSKKEKTAYVRPEITTYSAEEILRAIGPAVASYSPTAPSDRRFKKEIKSLEDGVQTVSNLRGVEFHWRTDEFPDRGFRNGRDIGLIAQEVEAVLPELVVTESSGFKRVDYAKMVAVLIEAVKELNTEKDDLRREITELKSSHTRLLERVSAFEDRVLVSAP